jgi:putative LysE/RhtB family amino acid efflux pump
MINHVLAGLLVGFGIAMPIGPMGLLCIQRTLTSGPRVGVSTGLGAATVNVVYGTVILLGLGTLPPWISGGQRVLGILGGLFMLWSAARTLRHPPLGGERVDHAAPTPLRAYGSAIAFNLTNPMAPILMLALLAPIAGHGAPSPMDAALLLAGIFAAAATWWVCLSFGVAVLRARLNPTVLRYVNHGAGLLLTAYGVLALARSTRM